MTSAVIERNGNMKEEEESWIVYKGGYAKGLNITT